jgi:hypothetical protein
MLLWERFHGMDLTMKAVARVVTKAPIQVAFLTTPTDNPPLHAQQ